ncbi:hypothetical protein LAZ67_11002066 [Cordylochernes scorpioides]|uniref:Transposable element Tc1 transposase n=1 Tax=Cordylochernes scorpioides TaxID=51811 RepID=A0ABY6L179_9ARAC|nr:hypothetical protein LAZ67_11002066 [Cordylochernes scorpioides]
MVIGLKRAGWSIRQIAADTHLGASTVHRLWRRWLEQGNVAIYRNAGATRGTSARVDRRILRQAVAAPQATCTAILQHVQDTLDHSISTRTISRRLVANGLHSCRPLRRLPLTPPNRRQRLEWGRARSTWMTEWHRVVFSDESRFCLSSDSRRVRVWRRRGERSNPAAIVERPTVRQRGIMVWGAIAYDSRSPLLRIQGTMTAQRYVDDVLRPVTLPYLQGVPNALYQQDNARPHTARISQQALQDVQMLPWPPYSPDLSPIEHVWDIIGRRLHALPQPRSEDELWQMVEREWRAIPQDAIRTLIDSLPRRVAACIVVRDSIRSVWISWNKVRPRLTRAISPKPWSLGGRFSVCQSWCCGFVTDPRPLVAATPHCQQNTSLVDCEDSIRSVWISWNKVRPRLTRAISPKPWSLGGRFSVCQSWCCGFVTDPRPLVAATLIERVRSGLHGLKVVILIWKTKKDPERHQSLKVDNQRQGSMKIQHKRKRNSQKHSESLTQPFDRLKEIGMIRKVGNWVTYELNPRDVERRFSRVKNCSNVEKKGVFASNCNWWVNYNYPKRRETYGYPGRASSMMAKPNIHGGKNMPCIRWDQLGVVYYELLQPNKSITGEVY